MPQGSAARKGTGVRAAIIALALFAASAALRAQSATIRDPVAFVTDVYKHYVAAQHGGDYNPPENIYTSRLASLIAADRKKHKGEVGCLDFDFWVDGQDYELKNVQVSGQDAPGRVDQKLVIAKFVNLGTAEEIHFEFRKIGGRWLIDDVESVKAKDSWTLSKVLQCKS